MVFVDRQSDCLCSCYHPCNTTAALETRPQNHSWINHSQLKWIHSEYLNCRQPGWPSKHTDLEINPFSGRFFPFCRTSSSALTHSNTPRVILVKWGLQLSAPLKEGFAGTKRVQSPGTAISNLAGNESWPAWNMSGDWLFQLSSVLTLYYSW